MQALGLNLASRFGLLEHIFSNLDFGSAKLNSNRTEGLLKIETLRTARDGEAGAAPSSAGGKLMSIQSLNMTLCLHWALMVLSLGGSSSASGP